jgi:hypothetical protein
MLDIFLMSRDSQLKSLIFGGVAADSTTDDGKKIKKKNSRVLSFESKNVGDDTFRHVQLHLTLQIAMLRIRSGSEL